MSNHTPGEWELVKDTQASWIIKANGRIIATVWSLEDGKDNIARAQEAQANARLIATAPKMLKVLGQAISRLAELDKILNPYVGLNTPIDDSAGRVLRSAHDVFIKAGGVCTCGYCRAEAEVR